MRKIREVLRLRASGLSQRAISASTGISKGTVSDYLKRASAAELGWDAAFALTDAENRSRCPLLMIRGATSPRSSGVIERRRRSY